MDNWPESKDERPEDSVECKDLNPAVMHNHGLISKLSISGENMIANSD